MSTPKRTVQRYWRIEVTPSENPDTWLLFECTHASDHSQECMLDRLAKTREVYADDERFTAFRLVQQSIDTRETFEVIQS